MDFFTFVIIALFVYRLFSKKDQPPQRRPKGTVEAPPAPQMQQAQPKMEPARQSQPKPAKGGFFENLEKQIREAAEKIEQELQDKTQEPQRPTPVKTYRRVSESRSVDTNKSAKTAYQQTEGVWGQEGRSDYDQYVSEQGTWGTEGSYYATKQKEKKSSIEKAEIGASPIYTEERYEGALALSSSAIIQGVIWAEVLKEPKGKKWISRL